MFERGGYDGRESMVSQYCVPIHVCELLFNIYWLEVGTETCSGLCVHLCA